MKLFLLVPECPYPANTGGRIVVWKRIQYLAERNDIYLFGVIDKKEELNYYSEIKKYCVSVKLYLRKSTLKNMVNSLIYPYPAVSRWNWQMKKDMENACKTVNPDYILVDLPQMLGNLSDFVKQNHRIVLNQQNIEFLLFDSIADNMNNLLKKLLYKLVSKQMEIYEKRIYKENYIDFFTFVSNNDKEYFETRYKMQNTFLLPIGSNVSDFPNEIPSKDIAFIGKMSYKPNEEGAIWFITNVWNYVKSASPTTKLFLVGKDPSDKLINIAKSSTNIIVTGTVDSVEEYYNKCSFVIAPLFSGGGAKVKLLEALGKGKLVITTQKGIEGTDFIDGQHLLVSDNEECFGKYCIEAINAPQRFNEIRKAAWGKIKAEYTWENIINNFAEKLESNQRK